MKPSVAATFVIGAIFLAVNRAPAQSYSAAGTACRTWTDLRASSRASPEMNWLQGYMVAAFDHQAILKQHTGDFSSEKLFTWIDAYCTREPVNSLREAVRALEIQLVHNYSASDSH
jgi:hypothetical protein